MHRRLVVRNRRFGTTGLIFKGEAGPITSEPICCYETSIGCVTSQETEDLIYAAVEARELALLQFLAIRYNSRGNTEN
jgi:hypothetical protein